MSPQPKVEGIPDCQPQNGETTSILDEVVLSGSDMDKEDLKGDNEELRGVQHLERQGKENRMTIVGNRRQQVAWSYPQRVERHLQQIKHDKKGIFY